MQEAWRYNADRRPRIEAERLKYGAEFQVTLAAAAQVPWLGPIFLVQAVMTGPFIGGPMV